MFRTRKELRQARALSPSLYHMVMEDVIKKIETKVATGLAIEIEMTQIAYAGYFVWTANIYNTIKVWNKNTGKLKTMIIDKDEKEQYKLALEK